MNGGPPVLSAADLGLAGTLLLVSGAVSLALRLELGTRIAWAATRTVVQLLAVGLVLRQVFEVQHPLGVLTLVAVMVGAAARAAVARPSRRIEGGAWMAFLSLSLTGLILTSLVTARVLRVQPWWDPRFLVPLLGMVLGNAMTGVSLCLDSLLEAFGERRAEVDQALALGADAWEAARPHVASAVGKGMIPILNSMAVVGLVSLPGMMTGQILAGADPFEAVKYQILIMFLLCAGTALGGVGVALLAWRRLFNSRHQLEASRIQPR